MNSLAMNPQTKIVNLPRAHKFYVLESCAQTYGHYYADTGSRGLPPSTVADMLSAKLNEVESLGKVIEIRDKEHGSEVTKIALIEARPNVRCYVVLRRYRSGARAIVRPDVPGGYAAIVSERTGAQCLVDGRWAPMINRPFDKLADVKLPEPAPHVSRPGVIDAVAMAVEQSDAEADTPRAESPRQYTREELEPAEIPDDPESGCEDEQPGRKSEALRAAADKLPVGWRSRAARVEREAFVRDIMRQRPHIKVGGADGLEALLRAKFGMSMSAAIIEQLRQEVAAEFEVPVATEPPAAIAAGRHHAEPPVAASPPATIARKVSTPAPRPTLATEKMAAIASAFAEATEREKIAKAAFASSVAAVRNAEADRDANAESVRTASAECDRLLDLMRAARE